MKTDRAVDGCCPRCDRELEYKPSYEYSDADGNRGIWIDIHGPCVCGWDETEEVCKCDYCGEVVEHLVDMAGGDEYCVDCAKNGEVADLPEPEVVTV